MREENREREKVESRKKRRREERIEEGKKEKREKWKWKQTE